MSATIDLQPLLLLFLCMPFITSMANECGNMLLYMYTKQKEENVLRDIFFLLAFGVYISVMGRTCLMAAVALMGKDDTSGNRTTTIIYMAAKEEEEKNNNVKQNTASKETKPDEADAPSKAPTTPPPVTEESKGPKNDKEDIYFELS